MLACLQVVSSRRATAPIHQVCGCLPLEGEAIIQGVVSIQR